MDTATTGMTLWDEWGNTTRFLESARIAFARERLLLESLALPDADHTRLSVPAGSGRYEVTFAQHLQAVADESTLGAAVLIQSYALVEAAAAEALGSAFRRGIEHWGSRLLAQNHQDWSAVLDGEQGAVEVAVVRHAFAHGTRRVDGHGAQRLLDAGAPARAEGTVVTATYAEVARYRARLRSLLRLGGLRAPSE